jgi:hypothetical protein
MDGSISLRLNETSTNGSPHLRVQCRSPVLPPTALGFSFGQVQRGN